MGKQQIDYKEFLIRLHLQDDKMSELLYDLYTCDYKLDDEKEKDKIGENKK